MSGFDQAAAAAEVAAAMRDHDPERMVCFDHSVHGLSCCPAGDHGFRDPRLHVAEQAVPVVVGAVTDVLRQLLGGRLVSDVVLGEWLDRIDREAGR